jgi:hypothetical protein
MVTTRRRRRSRYAVAFTGATERRAPASLGAILVAGAHLQVFLHQTVSRYFRLLTGEVVDCGTHESLATLARTETFPGGVDAEAAMVDVLEASIWVKVELLTSRPPRQTRSEKHDHDAQQ